VEKVPEIILFILALIWPLLILVLAKLIPNSLSTKRLILAGYFSVFSAFTISLSFWYFYYEPFAECVSVTVNRCSFLPQYAIHWYGEWSLVCNSIIALLIVLIYSSKKAA